MSSLPTPPELDFGIKSSLYSCTQQVVCKCCKEEHLSPEDFLFFGASVKNITALKVGGKVVFLHEQFSILQSLDMLEIVYRAHILSFKCLKPETILMPVLLCLWKEVVRTSGYTKLMGFIAGDGFASTLWVCFQMGNTRNDQCLFNLGRVWYSYKAIILNANYRAAASSSFKQIEWREVTLLTGIS